MTINPLRAGRVCLAAFLYVVPTIAAFAQPPVRELAKPDASTTDHFGLILSVRSLSDGTLLVNDAGRRQLVILDAKLNRKTLLLDSLAVGGDSYGPIASVMIPYVGDSTLFVDGESSSLLKIDPTGRIVGTAAAPRPLDIRFLAGSASGSDLNGNLLYRVAPVAKVVDPTGPGASIRAALAAPESLSIVRASFANRTVDSVAKVHSVANQRVTTETNGAKTTIIVTLNPLVELDECAVLSDGRVAIVRGHDYKVEILGNDGKVNSSRRIPYVQRPLTESDKIKLLDSARVERDKRDSVLKARQLGGSSATAISSDGTVARVRMRGGATAGAAEAPQLRTEFVNTSEISDYWPAIRAGSAKADMDGNLWVLPSSSEASKAGELVYDKINGQGELVSRVRLPVGRAIAGFGKGGVVFLMHKDSDAGWVLERTKLQ